MSTASPESRPLDTQPQVVKRSWWKPLRIAVIFCCVISLLSRFTHSYLLAVLLLVALLLPVAFVVGVYRQNRGAVCNLTPGRFALCAFLCIPCLIPMALILAPGFIVNELVDYGLDYAAMTAEQMLDAVDRKVTQVPEWMDAIKTEPYSWYHPYRWMGYNKVANVKVAITREVVSESFRVTGWTRVGLKWSRDAILLFQICSQATLAYVVCRGYGYIFARVAGRLGIRLVLVVR